MKNLKMVATEREFSAASELGVLCNCAGSMLCEVTPVYQH